MKFISYIKQENVAHHPHTTKKSILASFLQSLSDLKRTILKYSF